MADRDKWVENEIIAVLKEAKNPSDLDTILSTLRKNHHDIDNSSVRNAVWRLIGERKIELTSDQRLVTRTLVH